MDNVIYVNQLVARPLTPSEPLLSLVVKMPDQRVVNLLDRSLTGLSADDQATFLVGLLQAGVKTKEVVRLRYAHVMVDDSGVTPPWLEDFFPETVQSLSELWDLGPIYRSGDLDGEPSAFRGIQKCLSVPGQYDYLAAFGYEGGPDGSWTIAAVKEEAMLMLRDGTYISVVEFHANPNAYLLTTT